MMTARYSWLLAAAALSCLAMASLASEVDVELMAVSPDFKFRPKPPTGRVKDYSKDIQYISVLEGWIPKSAFDSGLSTCEQLCSLLDLKDSLAGQNGTYYGRGWTVAEVGNGYTGTVPQDDMFMSLKVTRVLGLCALILPGGNTSSLQPGTLVNALVDVDGTNLGPKGTAVSGCTAVFPFGVGTVATSLYAGGGPSKPGPYICGCQRACRPGRLGSRCQEKRFWGGRSCGANCDAALRPCGCRVQRWGAYWAGRFNPADGKCYASVLTPNNATGLLPPTDFQRSDCT